jgi:hypothetical protein
MKVNALVLAGVLSLVVSTGASAFGIGAQFNGNASGVFVPGAALAISPNDSTHLALNWYLGEKTTTLGLTGDFWILDPAISSFSMGSFNFFLGVGLFGNLWLHDGGNSSLHGGVRVPIGLHLYLNRQIFEIYLQAAPSLGLRFYPDFGGTDNFFIPFAVGFRFWIR